MLNRWTALDVFMEELFLGDDPVMEEIRKASDEGGLPDISVSPNQGKMLWMMAKIMGAKNILEVGTLGGYSTVWLARALPVDGKMVTLEYEPLHHRVATENIARAGFAGKVETRLGAGAELMAQLAAEGHEPFDLIFIDADKPGYADYFGWALKLSHPGTLIIADNVIFNGDILDKDKQWAHLAGIRKFLTAVSDEPRVESVPLSMVDRKGWDGFLFMRVKE
jgi:predicted O-methyltransferase YrrM